MTDEMRAKVEKVMKNLERNKMKPYFCENREEAQALVKTLIKKGETISCGGSKTLDETGIYQMINSPDYNFLDRSARGRRGLPSDFQGRHIFYEHKRSYRKRRAL